MKYGRFIVISLLLTSLVGCASNKPELPSSKIDNEKVINLKSGGYVKTRSYEYLQTDTQTPSDKVLRVITKGDTSKAVALKAASFFLNSLVGGYASESTFTKHQLKGTRVELVQNPAVSYFLPKINEIIEERLQVKDAGDYRDYPITLYYSHFYLVYSELAGSDKYELLYTMNLDIPHADEQNLYCTFTSASYPLKEWEFNSYQKVKDMTKEKLDECLDKFSAADTLTALASGLSQEKTASNEKK